MRSYTIENLPEIAKAIAKALGEGWSYIDKNDVDSLERKTTRAVLKHTDGRSFDLYSGYHTQGKLAVMGEYPRYEDGRVCMPRDAGAIQYNETNAKINVSHTRSPEVIARDIERRFLPEYTRCFLACVEAVKADSQHIKDTGSNAEKVRKALGKAADLKERPNRGDSRRVNVSLSYSALPFYGDFNINDGTGELSLKSVPVAVLVEIAAVIAKHAK